MSIIIRTRVSDAAEATPEPLGLALTGNPLIRRGGLVASS